MIKGKLIAIEGTDCSGKETQTIMLSNRLKSEGQSVNVISFPNYDSPTGKIVGGVLCGKPSISGSLFKNPAIIEPEVVSLYYAADRRYHLDLIEKSLRENEYVILDRYTYSSMAHQGGKKPTKEERLSMFHWIEKLEFDLLGLPKPDVAMLLYMPYEYTCILKSKRTELDLVEKDVNYLKNSEKAYLELAEYYNFERIDCVENNQIKSIEEIHEDVYRLIKR